MVRVYAWLAGLVCVLFAGVALAAPPAPSAAGATAVAPSVAPAASASSATKETKEKPEVKVRDKVIVALRVSHGDKSAIDRARAANQVIDAMLEKADEIGEVHVDEGTPGAAVIFAGKIPVITLGDEDATAAGEPSLHVLSANIAQHLEDALHGEQKRSRIATTVFSLSLVVFSGLIAFLLLGRVGELATRIRTWLKEHPDRLSALRLGNIEVLSVAAVRGAISIAVMLLYRLSQVAIVYGWLIFGLSLFESTRSYTERLGGFVLTPISALVSRVGSALPLLVIVLVASAVVFVFIRFVGLFLDSVARGETRVAWMPTDFAKPVSILVRSGVVVAALLVATPLITGSDDGAFSRAGLAALFALGVAVTPVLASVAAGAIVVFGRRLKRGDYIELGARAGRVIAVNLLEVRLLEREGSELRVPHLIGLWQPTRVIGKLPLTAVEVVLRSAADTDCRRAIDEAVRPLGGKIRIQLLSLDAHESRYRVTAEEPSSGALDAALRRAVARMADGIFIAPQSDFISSSTTSIPPPSVVSPSVPPPPVATPSAPPPTVVPAVALTTTTEDDKK